MVSSAGNDQKRDVINVLGNVGFVNRLSPTASIPAWFVTRAWQRVTGLWTKRYPVVDRILGFGAVVPAE